MRWNKNPVRFGSLRSVLRESSSNFTIQDFDLEGDEDILVSVPIWLSLCVVDDDNDGDRENEKERVCVCVCICMYRVRNWQVLSPSSLPTEPDGNGLDVFHAP